MTNTLGVTGRLTKHKLQIQQLRKLLPIATVQEEAARATCYSIAVDGGLPLAGEGRGPSHIE